MASTSGWSTTDGDVARLRQARRDPDGPAPGALGPGDCRRSAPPGVDAALTTSVHLACCRCPADAPVGDWAKVLREPHGVWVTEWRSCRRSERTGPLETPAPRRSPTTALRALLTAEQARGPDFLRLAKALAVF
ncbi:MAG: hypothetical protein ONB06_05580 [candidate division KSB1 bacterium]|nr:hypothetical protein [candidate division KSB1 bacterium]